jgi:hypothetical protein
VRVDQAGQEVLRRRQFEQAAGASKRVHVSGVSILHVRDHTVRADDDQRI